MSLTPLWVIVIPDVFLGDFVFFRAIFGRFLGRVLRFLVGCLPEVFTLLPDASQRSYTFLIGCLPEALRFFRMPPGGLTLSWSAASRRPYAFLFGCLPEVLHSLDQLPPGGLMLS